MDLELPAEHTAPHNDGLLSDPASHSPMNGLPLNSLDEPALGLLDPATADQDAAEPPAPLNLDDEPPPMSAEEQERRKRRRKAWEQEQEGKRRWELQRRIIDIGTDVELLTREVCEPVLVYERENAQHVVIRFPAYVLKPISFAPSRIIFFPNIIGSSSS